MPQMTIMTKIVRTVRAIAKSTLRSYLFHRRKLLMFGYYPGIKLKFISGSDPIYKELKNALLRCRAFPGDLDVFQHIEPETRYLQDLTSLDKISIDVGANLGFYSAILAPLSSRVFACEANPNLYPYLTFNLQRNKNIFLLPFAISHSNGEVVFNIPKIAGGDSLSISGQGGVMNLFAKKSGLESYPFRVPTLAIDTLALNNVGFMKIDVEGSELDVLEGAVLTIERCRPNIIIENEYRHNPECLRVFDFLHTRNYQGYFIDRQTNRLKPFADFSLERNQLDLLTAEYTITNVNHYVFNFIFVPRESDKLKIKSTFVEESK